MLNKIWKDRNIRMKQKTNLLRSIVISTSLYACESWTMTAELQKRIDAFEMRCYRRILGISYKDRVSNQNIRTQITNHIGPHDDLFTTVKKRKLKFFGNTLLHESLAKTIIQDNVKGGRKRGRPRKKWSDNIKEWTGHSIAQAG